jgi:hypothetical protein
MGCRSLATPFGVVRRMPDVDPDDAHRQERVPFSRLRHHRALCPPAHHSSQSGTHLNSRHGADLAGTPGCPELVRAGSGMFAGHGRDHVFLDLDTDTSRESNTWRTQCEAEGPPHSRVRAAIGGWRCRREPDRDCWSQRVRSIRWGTSGRRTTPGSFATVFGQISIH